MSFRHFDRLKTHLSFYEPSFTRLIGAVVEQAPHFIKAIDMSIRDAHRFSDFADGAIAICVNMPGQQTITEIKGHVASMSKKLEISIEDARKTIERLQNIRQKLFQVRFHFFVMCFVNEDWSGKALATDRSGSSWAGSPTKQWAQTVKDARPSSFQDAKMWANFRLVVLLQPLIICLLT